MASAESTQQRARRLLACSTAPLRRAIIVYSLGVPASLVAAVAGVISGVPFIGVVVGMVGGVALSVALVRSVSGPDANDAWELIHEHEAFESAEYRRRFGRAKPRSWGGILSEAERSSDPVQRAAYLIALGRINEADKLLETAASANADERLGLELAHQQSALIGGRPLDRDAIQVRLEQIAEPAQRRHREHCVGLHDALVAGAEGLDPTPSIAEAWRRGLAAEPSRRPWSRRDGHVFWLLVTPVLLGFLGGFVPTLLR